MTISELGAIGEFIAAIVVLVTLIYLAIQVKQTQLAVSANTNQAINDISIQLYLTAASCEPLANALALSFQDGAKLTNAQYQQVRGFWSAITRNAENVHFQYRKGLLEEAQVIASTEILCRLMRKNPHFRKLWDSLGTGLRPEFRDWMDERIESKKNGDDETSTNQGDAVK